MLKSKSTPRTDVKLTLVQILFTNWAANKAMTKMYRTFLGLALCCITLVSYGQNDSAQKNTFKLVRFEMNAGYGSNHLTGTAVLPFAFKSGVDSKDIENSSTFIFNRNCNPARLIIYHNFSYNEHIWTKWITISWGLELISTRIKRCRSIVGQGWAQSENWRGDTSAPHQDRNIHGPWYEIRLETWGEMQPSSHSSILWFCGAQTSSIHFWWHTDLRLHSSLREEESW